ncbi:MAG: hypothetical protein RBR49_12590 [Desulfovibrio desulfuricans]|nr:hypothetical protein [Desulfovibrio desulfuricans]
MLDANALTGLIVAALRSEGFETAGHHAMVERMARAIAQAFVDHMQSSAEVNVDRGSSSGTYRVT